MSVGKLCTFKVIFHDDIRRWKVDADETDSNRFQSLQTFVAEAFNLRDFQLQYFDDEGDKITLANHNDFEEALCVALTMKNTLRVTVITQSNETKRDLDSTEIVYQTHSGSTEPVQSDIETEMKADLNAKLQNSDIATVENKAPDKQHSDIETVENKSPDKQHQTQRIRLRIESPPPQIECYLDGTQFSDEEEIEALGLDTNEWNLQLKFDNDNLTKRALCNCWTLLLAPWCIGLLCVPFCWCVHTAITRKFKRKKVILTEQKLITKAGAYSCECCLSGWEEKIYSVPIEYEKLTVLNFTVSDSSCGGCGCCGDVKRLSFRSRNVGFRFALEGLSDPDGIRKLMLKIRDEKKKGNIDSDKKIDPPKCPKDNCSKKTKIMVQYAGHCQKCGQFMPNGTAFCHDGTVYMVCYRCAIKEMEEEKEAEIVAMNEREEMVASAAAAAAVAAVTGAVSAEAALNRQIQLSHHNVAANDDIGLQVAETSGNVTEAIVGKAIKMTVHHAVDEIVGDVVDVVGEAVLDVVVDGAVETVKEEVKNTLIDTVFSFL